MKGLRTIILAAGKGTRMKSSIPKVLHTVCGKAMIAYVLDAVKAAGSLKTCVVLGHQAGTVRGFLDKTVATVVQQRLLGTADAVKCAQAKFRSYTGDVLVLCADAPLIRKETIRALVRKHKKTNAACTFLTAVVRDSTGYGRVIRGVEGEAVAIREEMDATEYERHIAQINVGAYCFKSDILFKAIKVIQPNPKKKEYYLTDIIEILADQGLKVETVETNDPNEGLGINSRKDLAAAEAVIRQRILEDLMAEGVTIVDPQTTYVAAGVRIDRDTVIEPMTVIEQDVRIGSHCRVGPFARLRPGTRIGNHVQVGNFTEVSRSRLGDHSLMKHFGFIGDASTGVRVNIGAGVVTANYDGQGKNKTRIENGAFIGSDSILVAPVKIGKKAVTGAGCVVAGRTVPDGKTVVGVPAKVIDKKRR